MQDVLSAPHDFNLLSLEDLLKARELFHRHLINKRHVVATAVGKYLIRKTDPWPTPEQPVPPPPEDRQARTLDRSEVRPYSWPCILVFVDEWQEKERFGGTGDSQFDASDLVPKALYMPDGLVVPVCVVSLERGDRPPPPAVNLAFAPGLLGGGYPVTMQVQGRQRVGSIGCLVTDGHLVYALTNRHVVGEPGTPVYTEAAGMRVEIGTSAKKQLTKQPFETVYPKLPGQRVLVNLDIGLIEVADLNRWTAQVYGIGEMGPLADLNDDNVSLRLIGAPVRAHGAVSGPLLGQIDALFYRYKAVGGFEYVADFLIGPRSVGDTGVQTLPGDSGTVWLLDPPPPEKQQTPAALQVRAERDREKVAEATRLVQQGQDPATLEPDPNTPADPVQEPDPVQLSPLAVQWGGEVVLGARDSSRTYVLASALSTACRLLDLDVIRDWNVGLPEYWGSLGHFTVASFAVEQLPNGSKLQKLMRANLSNIGFPREALVSDPQDFASDGFARLANVPDTVWKRPERNDGQGGRQQREQPTHFADIDKRRVSNGKTLLEEIEAGTVAVSVANFKQYYEDAQINADNHGIVPFRVQQIYQEMVKSARHGNATRFICAAGIMAHYVGDACQPLHCSFKFNGNPAGPGPTGRGVHSFYETDMIDFAQGTSLLPEKRLVGLLPAEIAALPTPAQVVGGQQVAESIVRLMIQTVKTLPPDQIIGEFITLSGASQKKAKMWQALGGQTVTVMARGIKHLAMLWESAWDEGAGEAHITTSSAISRTALRKLYETNVPTTEFLTSRKIDQIQSVL